MTKINDTARDTLKECFAHDMAEHQKRIGKLPTPEENRKLVEPEFEKLERQLQDDWARFKAKSKPRADKRSFEDKVRGSEWTYFKAEGDGNSGTIPRFTMDDIRARERIALLVHKKERGPKGQPSWRDRVMAMVLRYERDKALGYPYHLNRGAALMERILDESSKVFGDWRKPQKPEPRLYSL